MNQKLLFLSFITISTCLKFWDINPQMMSEGPSFPSRKRQSTDQCSVQYKCSGEGGTCGIFDNNQITICNSKTYCAISGTSGTCRKVKTSGACTDDDECGDPNGSLFNEAQYQCNDQNQCEIRPESSDPGESCTSSASCRGLVPCVGGKCQGKTSGTCYNEDGIADNYYCDLNTNTTAKSKGEGASCVDNKECAFPTICGGTTGATRCVRVFTRSAGSACQEGSECTYGLYCANNVCTNIPSPTKSCYNETDCETIPGSDCGCVESSRKCLVFGIPKNCGPLVDATIDCANRNGGSINNCQNEAACYTKCVYQQFGGQYVQSFECTFGDLCSDSSMLSIGFALLFLIVIMF